MLKQSNNSQWNTSNKIYFIFFFLIDYVENNLLTRFQFQLTDYTLISSKKVKIGSQREKFTIISELHSRCYDWEYYPNGGSTWEISYISCNM